MKKLFFIVPIVGLLAVSCTKSPEPVSPAPLQSAALYDQSIWQLATQQNADVNGDNLPDEILLLKTINSVDTSALEEPEFGVKVAVVSNGQKIYEYTPSEDQRADDVWPVGFYRADSMGMRNFYVEDLTGDGIKDIVLKVGISGASDWSNCNGIITYNRQSQQLQSGNPRSFCSSYNQGIMIRDIASSINGVEILRAIPTNGVIEGNKVFQRFNIEVWTWNGWGWGKFKTFASSRVYEDGYSALEGEASQIAPAFWTN